jgi:hypothetical protein
LNPIWVWKMVQKGVMNDVRAWQLLECVGWPGLWRLLGGLGSSPSLGEPSMSVFCKWISIYTFRHIADFFFVRVGGGVEESLLLEIDNLSLSLGSFISEFSTTLNKVFLVVCFMFLT